MARPKKSDEPDWPIIYADWLTGKLSNHALSRKHGVSAAAIGRRVKVDQWSTTNGPGVKPPLTEPAEPETPKVSKRKPDVSKSLTPEQLRKRAKDLAQRLLAEVEDVTTYEGEIGDIIVTEESDSVRRRAALKAISSGERIKNLKEITAIIDAVDPKRKAVKADKPDAAANGPIGKKAERQAEAEKIVGAGRFSPRPAPRLVGGAA